MNQEKIKFFIGSGAELTEEREKCISIFHRISRSHIHLSLEPILWEYEMVKSNFLGFKNIQSAINPTLATCDVAIFIFYSKIGKYTREEFELAAKSKTVFVFFKNGFKPTAETQVEYNELMQFKACLNDTILYNHFNNISEFELKLFENTNHFLSKNFNVKRNYEKTIEVLKREKEQVNTDLKELQHELSRHSSTSDLKRKALSEITNNNYSAAETTLLQSLQNEKAYTSDTLYELGKLKHIQGKYLEAQKFFELAANNSARNSQYLHSCGVAARSLGQYDKAAAYMEKALMADIEKFDKDNLEIAERYNNLGVAFRDAGKIDKAFEVHAQALKIITNLKGIDCPEIEPYYNNIGLVYLDKGEFERAIMFFDLSIKANLKYNGKENKALASYLNNSASVHEGKGNINEAIKLYEQALNILEQTPGNNALEIATCYNNLGLAHQTAGNYRDSISLLEKALSMNKNILGNTHPYIAITNHNLGLTFLHMNNPTKALEYIQIAYNMDKNFYSEESITIATRYNSFGAAHLNLGDLEKALHYFNKAYLMLSKLVTHNHPHLKMVEQSILGIERRGKSPLF